MADSSNNSGSNFVSFLTGAAAGALAGILLAPDKGSTTRKKIKSQAQNVGSEIDDNVHEKVDGLKNYINDFVDDVKTRFDDLEKEMKIRAEETKNQAARNVEKKAKEAQK